MAGRSYGIIYVTFWYLSQETGEIKKKIIHAASGLINKSRSSRIDKGLFTPKLQCSVPSEKIGNADNNEDQYNYFAKQEYFCIL